MRPRTPPPLDQLGRRERQIMDVLFRQGRATATDVQAALGEPVSNSAVRGMLRLLVDKGYATYAQDGPRYVYSAVGRAEEVRRSAVRHLLDTFFRSSPSSAMAALLDVTDGPLPDAEYERLSALLEQARRKGGPA
jgi:predicted transcriptional regulator